VPPEGESKIKQLKSRNAVDMMEGKSELGVLKLLGWTEVALREFLEGKIKSGTHHPSREDHETSDDENYGTHQSHHEPDILLVLGVFLLPLGLGRSELASDLTLSGFGILGGEDGFDKLFDLSTDNADLQEVGILRGVLLVNFAGVHSEAVAQDTKVLSRLVHELTCVSLGDLDVLFEDVGVAETQFHGRNSHRLRDCAEVENTLLTETSQVEETFLGMLQGIQNHLGVAVESGIEVLRFEEILKIVNVLGPDLLRPESAVVVKVLPDVTDDVGLLKEETHRLVESGALQQSGVTELRLHKEAGKTLADQASNIVAVQVVLFLGLHAGIVILRLHSVIGHSVAHLLGDVLDDSLIFRLHVHELSDDVVELDQQLTILLLWSVSSEVPPILCQNILKVPEEGLLGGQRNGSVILNGVQPTEDQVENANRDQQLGVKFLDHSTETAAGLVQKLKAELLVLGLVLLVTLMGRVMPDFPI